MPHRPASPVHVAALCTSIVGSVACSLEPLAVPADGAGGFSVVGGSGGSDAPPLPVFELRTYPTRAWLRDVEVAADGSVYLLLTYDDDKVLYLGAPSLAGEPLTSFGRRDFAIAKIRSSGEVEWTRSFGGPDHEHGRGLAVAPNGDLVTCGKVYEEVDFGGGPLAPTSSYGDAFVMRLSAEGDHLWSTLYHSEQSNWPTECVVAQDGAIFVSMWSLVSEPAPVVLAYLPSGELAWVHAAQVGLMDSVYLEDLVLDSAGNVVAAGGFYGTVDAGLGPVTGDDGDGYVISLSPVGAPRWQFVEGGPNRTELSHIASTPTGVVVAGLDFLAPDFRELDPIVRGLSNDGETLWTFTRRRGRLAVYDVVGSRAGGAWVSLQDDDPPRPVSYLLEIDDAGEPGTRIDLAGTTAVGHLVRRDDTTILAAGRYHDGSVIVGKRLRGEGIFLLEFDETRPPSPR